MSSENSDARLITFNPCMLALEGISVFNDEECLPCPSDMKLPLNLIAIRFRRAGQRLGRCLDFTNCAVTNAVRSGQMAGVDANAKEAVWPDPELFFNPCGDNWFPLNSVFELGKSRALISSQLLKEELRALAARPVVLENDLPRICG
jgi:hypothetical protein